MPKDSIGDFTFVLDADNGKETTRAEQDIALPTTGFAIFGNISGPNLSILAKVGGVILIILSLYLVIKFLVRHNKRVRVEEKKGRHFIKLNLND